jgi:hypothetical protein
VLGLSVRKTGLHFSRLDFDKAIFGTGGLDAVEFVHGDPFFGKYPLLGLVGNIENIYNSVTGSVKSMC